MPPSDEKCREIIQKLRWKEGVRCVFCESKAVVKRGKDKKGFQRYLCKECKRTFNDRTKTIFDKSKLAIWEWFYIIKEHSAGRSIYSIAMDLGRKYEHVWKATKKIKQDLLAKQIASKLKGNVEMDETYLTAGEKGNRRLSRKPRKRGETGIKGRGGLKEGKIPIIAITERKGKSIFFIALEGLSEELILELLETYVEKGSTVNIDGSPIYTQGNREKRL